MKMGRYTGFTLIELMIVIVVIGILVAVAFPSYQDHIRKGKRAEGKTALLKAGQLLERFYSDRNTYEGGPPLAGVIQVAPLFGLAVGAVVFSSEDPTNPGSTGVAGTGNAAYRITAQAPTAACPLNACFEIRATPNAPTFADPACGYLSLTSTGVRNWELAPANAATCRW